MQWPLSLFLKAGLFFLIPRSQQSLGAVPGDRPMAAGRTWGGKVAIETLRKS